MEPMTIWDILQTQGSPVAPGTSPLVAAYQPTPDVTNLPIPKPGAVPKLPIKSVTTSVRSPQPGSYTQEFEDAYKNMIDRRGADTEALKSKLAELQGEKPTGFDTIDLSRAANFVDGVTGSNMSSMVKAPTAAKEHEAKVQRLQEAISKEQNGLSDDQLGYLKMKADEEKMKVAYGREGSRQQRQAQSDEFRLREKWESNPVTKASQSMDNHYRRITGVNTNTPAGQMSMVFAYMKMLDDGSVVRESEFANAARTAGLYDRAGTYMEKLKSGKLLSEKQIKEFHDSANQIMDEVRQKQGMLDSEYKNLASEYGFNPKRVVYGVSFKDAPKVASTPAGEPDWNNMSDEELRKYNGK